MSNLRSKLIRLASTLSKGTERAALLNVLASGGGKWQGGFVMSADIFWDAAYYVREKSPKRPSREDAKRNGIPVPGMPKAVLFPKDPGFKSGERLADKHLAELQMGNPGTRYEVVSEFGTTHWKEAKGPAPKRPSEYEFRKGESWPDRVERIVSKIPHRQRRRDMNEYWVKWDAYADYPDTGEGYHWQDKDGDEEQRTFLTNLSDAQYMERVEEERSGAADTRREQERLKMEEIHRQIALRRKWERKPPSLPSEYGPWKSWGFAKDHHRNVLQIPRRKRERDAQKFWNKWVAQADPDLDMKLLGAAGADTAIGMVKRRVEHFFLLRGPERKYQNYVDGKGHLPS